MIMWITKAERSFLRGTVGWVGVKLLVHGHDSAEPTERVLKHFLHTNAAGLFTGTDDVPGYHGPWPSDGQLWRRFTSAPLDSALQLLAEWLDEANYLVSGAGAPTVRAENAAILRLLVSDALDDDQPATVLVAYMSAEEGARADDSAVGVLTGFVELIWRRPGDGTLVVVTATDD